MCSSETEPPYQDPGYVEPYEPEPVEAPPPVVEEPPMVEESPVVEAPLAPPAPPPAPAIEPAPPSPVEQAPSPAPEWTPWEPPAPPAPGSFTPEGASTDWGTVEPGWSEQGDPPLPSAGEAPPLDSAVAPGQPFGVYWEDQGDTGYCPGCGAQVVLAETLGQSVESGELIDRAAANGWLSFDDSGDARGVQPDAFGELLASYGVASHTLSGEEDAWTHVNDALANDQRVVIPVGQPGGELPMAIAGVDYARGVVQLGDSAAGPPVDVPIERVHEAWRASDFQMTVVEGDTGLSVLNTTLHPSVGLQTEAAPLTDRPSAGSAALGDWWAAADGPASCCVTPDVPAETPIEFADAAGEVHELEGVDTDGTGQADLAMLDANGDSRPDTWVFDTTGDGRANLMYYDSLGTGEPDSVSCCTPDGAWVDPVPLTTALNSALPDQPPGTPFVWTGEGAADALGPQAQTVAAVPQDAIAESYVPSPDLAQLNEVVSVTDNEGTPLTIVPHAGLAEGVSLTADNNLVITPVYDTTPLYDQTAYLQALQPAPIWNTLANVPRVPEGYDYGVNPMALGLTPWTGNTILSHPYTGYRFGFDSGTGSMQYTQFGFQMPSLPRNPL